MSIKKKISISNAITEVIDMTSPEYLDMKPTLIRWAIRADQKIGSAYAYKREIILRNVSDNIIELPDDVVYVKAILLGDQLDKDLDAFYNDFHSDVQKDEQVIYGTTTVLYWSVLSGGFRCEPLIWKVIDNSIVFDRTVNSEQATLMVLRYFRDENGLPMVNENHIEAIGMYLKYMIAEKERFKSFKKVKLTGMANNYVYEIKNEWRRSAANARATDGDTSSEHVRVLSEILNHPLTGDGLLRIG